MNLLSLQWYYWYRNVWFKQFKTRQKIVQRSWYLKYWILVTRLIAIKKVGSGYDVNSVNPLYLRINNVNGYIEEVDEEKYLVFDNT